MNNAVTLYDDQESAQRGAVKGIFSGGGNTLQTSLPMTTPAEKLRVIRLTQGVGENIGKYVGKKITVVDVIAHPAQFKKKETGEVTYGVRCVLVLKDGKAVTCASAGIAKSLGMIADVYGPPSWGPNGLALEVEQIALPGGHRFYQLLPAE